MSIVWNREEAASWPDFGERLCIVCGQHPTEGHHMPPKGMAGGMGWQGAILRLCHRCHMSFHANRIELLFANCRWWWRGEVGNTVSRRWTPCHDDDYWHMTGG